jgi:hypothetical protein
MITLLERFHPDWKMRRTAGYRDGLSGLDAAILKPLVGSQAGTGGRGHAGPQRCRVDRTFPVTVKAR